ncbi:MAG TPA: hypothetical protein VHO95_05150 [Candidatus Dormibacteraeota bacterium]|jgi:hypothetical protein|nr:hypothetical protein [Candidatus Dormibacteraeota bacterium]
MSRNEELEQQITALNRTIDEMRARIVRLESGAGMRLDGHEKPRSRRSFLKLGAAAAAGAAGLVAGRIIPAAAADGATVATGATVTGEHPTIIKGDAATAVPVLATQDPNFSQANLTAFLTAQGDTIAAPLQGLGGTTGAIEGVDGWAQGAQAFGVYGLTDAGTGVVGESSTGISLHARGSGRIRQDPQSSAPSYTPNNFEMVRDPSGNLWLSQAGGVWRQVAIMHTFPNPRRVWDGWVQPMGPGIYGPIDATTEVGTSGFTAGPSGVPAGAQAAYCAVMSYNAGVMTLYPDLTSDTGIGNWASTVDGVLNMMFMFVPLSPAGKFNFHAYFTGRKFVDVWGYLM